MRCEHAQADALQAEILRQVKEKQAAAKRKRDARSAYRRVCLHLLRTGVPCSLRMHARDTHALRRKGAGGSDDEQEEQKQDAAPAQCKQEASAVRRPPPKKRHGKPSIIF